jgi:hypothetical protein
LLERRESRWEWKVKTKTATLGATPSHVPDVFPERLQVRVVQRRQLDFVPSQGYTVVHGSMMSAATWQNAKSAKAILPAGQVTPGLKVWTGEGNPNAIPFED